MKNNRGWNRCIYCCRFFSLKEVEDDKIGCYFTPDTSFSQEEVRLFHKDCLHNEEDNHE